MGIKALEAAILAELREVAEKRSLRQKDIMEWKTGKELQPQEGETLYYLPRLQISVCVKIEPKAKKTVEVT